MAALLTRLQTITDFKSVTRYNFLPQLTNIVDRPAAVIVQLGERRLERLQDNDADGRSLMVAVGIYGSDLDDTDKATELNELAAKVYEKLEQYANSGNSFPMRWLRADTTYTSNTVPLGVVNEIYECDYATTRGDPYTLVGS